MRILYLTASPQFVELPAHAGEEPEEREYPKLDLWPELRAVNEALFDARAEGYVNVEVVPEARREDLQRYLSRRDVNVLHFSGHGDKDLKLDKDADDNLEAGILFNEEPGYGEFVTNEWLQDQLGDKDITVLVLNCCWSNGVAQALDGCVDVVIGTTSPLMSSDARRFSATFYDALQRGLTLGEARDKAQEVIGTELYAFHPKEPDADVWKTVIAPQPEEEVNEDQIDMIELCDRFEKVRDGYWENLGLDLVKIALGFALAFGGYYFLQGAETTLNNLDETKESIAPEFWRDFVGYIVKAVQGSPWLKFEPFAIMIAFAAAPLGRIFGAPLIYLIAPLAKLTLTGLSLRTYEYLEGEIEGKRLESISQWLEEFER